MFRLHGCCPCDESQATAPLKGVAYRSCIVAFSTRLVGGKGFGAKDWLCGYDAGSNSGLFSGGIIALAVSIDGLKPFAVESICSFL